MQKVEGSSPFIRSSETRWKRLVSCCQDGGRTHENRPRVSTRYVAFVVVVIVGSEALQHLG